MNRELESIIKDDIERCKKLTTVAGSVELFQALASKYNGYFPGFYDEIIVRGSLTPDGGRDYRPEVHAVQEKLELAILAEHEKDPIYDFRKMLKEDIDKLKNVCNAGSENEIEKQNLYTAITARYHSYIPQLGSGLYGYNSRIEFYEEVNGESLNDNLKRLYHKLCAFDALGCPGLNAVAEKSPNTVVTITNTNQNTNTVAVSFETARETVNAMTSLPDEEIQDIQAKIDEIEEIVKSKDSKSKKWSKAKEIIKWIADKGVDVGIALLPLVLQIG